MQINFYAKHLLPARVTFSFDIWLNLMWNISMTFTEYFPTFLEYCTASENTYKIQLLLQRNNLKHAYLPYVGMWTQTKILYDILTARSNWTLHFASALKEINWTLQLSLDDHSTKIMGLTHSFIWILFKFMNEVSFYMEIWILHYRGILVKLDSLDWSVDFYLELPKAHQYGPCSSTHMLTLKFLHWIPWPIRCCLSQDPNILAWG